MVSPRQAKMFSVKLFLRKSVRQAERMILPLDVLGIVLGLSNTTECGFMARSSDSACRIAHLISKLFSGGVCLFTS
jgi:hypothetical protein